MSISFNSLKRPFEEAINPPKRLKTEEIHSSEPIFGNTTHTLMIIAHSTIAELGNFACVSKQSNTAAQIAFLQKARALGYTVQDSAQAKIRLQRLYQHLCAINEFSTRSLPSKEKAAFNITNWTLPSILSFLCRPKVYKNPDHPILELLEIKSSWKNAKVGERQLTQQEQSNGQMALRYAAYYKKPQLVKLLLEHQINPNSNQQVAHHTDSRLFLPRPLQSAILAGNFESVKHLLAHGAKLKIVDQGAWQQVANLRLSVLQCALGSKEVRTLYPQAELNIPMLEFLLKKEAKITPEDMIAAVETCSIDLVRSLRDQCREFNAEIATKALTNLVRVNVESNNCAFDNRLDEMLAFLLKEGADINGHDWSIPIEIAVEKRSLPWIQYLATHGANLEITNDDGLSPLMLATSQGSFEVVKFLLENRVNVNQRIIDDENDDRPLHNALTFTCLTEEDNSIYDTTNNNPEIVKLLLKHGAKPILESDSEEYSALYLARKNGLTEIVNILEDHIASSMLNE